MSDSTAFVRRTELDRSTLPAFLDGIQEAEGAGTPTTPRSYPGYPRWQLTRARLRRFASYDKLLMTRRSSRTLGISTPAPQVLGRLLQLAHGISADHHRGPVPSAGGLQALELYLVAWTGSWLPAGRYHYDRIGHQLAQIAAGAERDAWQQRVPSLRQIDGGALLWVLVGDTARVTAKYGERGTRFLLLEAGHLMQNLCLASTSLGLATVPLGGCLEQEIGRQFQLPAADLVLYVAACGARA